MKEKVVFAWSSGKDSALALHEMRQDACYDEQFLSDLPPHVDPCGENGELHSFVFGGPLFSRPVRFKKGEVVVRDNRFHFCELLPV